MSTGQQRLRAIRGAITAAANDRASITDATGTLLAEMLVRNELAHEDLVSVIFTATPDLTAEFPAAAARRLGISDIPLLCATEMGVPGAVERCIRVLMHAYTTRAYDSLRHVYLEGAKQLRTDLLE